VLKKKSEIFEFLTKSKLKRGIQAKKVETDVYARNKCDFWADYKNSIRCKKKEVFDLSMI